MLQMPLRRNPARQRTAQIAAVPAPVGGWNARDPVTDMKPNEAILLENIIPGSDGCRLRKGYQSHATGITGNYVETLMTWSGPDGTKEMYAAAPADIFEVSTAGAVGAAAVTSLSNGRWSWLNFATTGGQYLVACNGTDAVQNYDGTTWTTPTITGTGLTSTDLIYVTAHMQRLWFIEKDTLDVWYLGVGAISGTATKFPLGSLCKLGGYLVAMGSWTRDGGAGLDDVAVFITSMGEAILYSGTDPSSASTWQIVGIFRIPEPIGRNCLVKIGGDLAVITTQGVVALSEILPIASSGQGKKAATDMISGAYRLAYEIGSAQYGWQVVESPPEKLLIVNVPVVERTESIQYVMNTETGKWCKFTNFDAGCWCLYNDDLYWGGSDGVVYKYTGETDGSTAAIDGRVTHAYSAYGTPHRKSFERARPVVFGPADYIPTIQVTTDFADPLFDLTAQPWPSEGSYWDEVFWDAADWAAASVPSIQWQAVSGDGITAAVNVALSSTQGITYNGALLTYRAGGPL